MVACFSSSVVYTPTCVVFEDVRFTETYGYVAHVRFRLYQRGPVSKVAYHSHKHKTPVKCLFQITTGLIAQCSVRKFPLRTKSSLCLPPHTTHGLQPLEGALFKPPKTFNQQQQAANASISRSAFRKLFTPAWNKAANYGNATEGVQSTSFCLQEVFKDELITAGTSRILSPQSVPSEPP